MTVALRPGPEKRALERQRRAKANGRRGRRAFGVEDKATRRPVRLRRALARAAGARARAARKANR
jgi:hypothetical protein